MVILESHEGVLSNMARSHWRGSARSAVLRVSACAMWKPPRVFPFPPHLNFMQAETNPLGFYLVLGLLSWWSRSFVYAAKEVSLFLNSG